MASLDSPHNDTEIEEVNYNIKDARQSMKPWGYSAKIADEFIWF